MLVVCGLVLVCDKPALAENCNLFPHNHTDKALVKWVYDGDTLLVTNLNKKNERKIRIIGIDTPEVKHHQQKAQAYAAKAREALRVLLKRHNYRVLLAYDKTRYDRYKRVLAHVYLEDGTNISEWLLQQGLARTLVIPPNVKHATCYKTTEIEAQQAQRKIWRLKNHKLTHIGTLNANRKGYIRLVARVKTVKIKKKTVLLTLEKAANNKALILRIKKKHLPYFTSTNPLQLQDKTIIATGVLKKKRGKRLITLSHGSQLVLLSSNREKESHDSLVPPL